MTGMEGGRLQVVLLVWLPLQCSWKGGGLAVLIHSGTLPLLMLWSVLTGFLDSS